MKMSVVYLVVTFSVGGNSACGMLSDNCFSEALAASCDKATDGVVICSPMVSGTISCPLSAKNERCIKLPSPTTMAMTAAAFSKGVMRTLYDTHRAYKTNGSVAFILAKRRASNSSLT